MNTSSPRPSLISILSWGGIGDTLRNISLVPHEMLFRSFRIRCRVYYMHWSRTNFLVETGPPNPKWFEDLVLRCPSLCWGGEVHSYGGFGRMTNLALRLGIRATRGAPRYYHFAIRLSDAEQAQLPGSAGGFCVAIQTHLSGMKTKQWGLENWRTYLAGLLADRDLSILLFDSDERIEQLCFDPRIRNTRALNLPQSIALLQRCDFLVSIDSWSKYVAAWSGIPQLLIVPDQQSEYVLLSAPNLIKHELAGIYGQPNVEVIGISNGPQPVFTLASLAELSPDRLLARTREQIAKIKASGT